MICQSCGMPMENDEQHGTNGDGSKNEEFCRFCFMNGAFTFNGTYEEFLEKQIKIAVEKMGLSQDKAREMAENKLPALKRWKEQN